MPTHKIGPGYGIADNNPTVLVPMSGKRDPKVGRGWRISAGANPHRINRAPGHARTDANPLALGTAVFSADVPTWNPNADKNANAIQNLAVLWNRGDLTDLSAFDRRTRSRIRKLARELEA